jgi:3-dehydrosphinganine reductase
VSSTVRAHFDGKLVLVTGGSKGIGLAFAETVAGLGAGVCLVARGAAGLDAAKATVERARKRPGQIVETLACDTTDLEALRPLLTGMVERHGTPHFLVNCVGFARPGYLEDLDIDVYRRHIEVNYFGQLHPILVLLPFMLRAGRGHIVNVSSVLGFMGILGYAAYCPSKYAVVGLTEALRSELAPRGIACSVAFPPDVDTPGYREENKTKPPECAEMSKRGGLVTARDVAADLARGIARSQFEILPGAAGRVRRLVRFLPGIVRAVTDRDLRKAREALRPEYRRRNEE